MLRKLMLFLIVFGFSVSNSFAYEHQQTSTGFYWPIGIADYDHACGGWLGRDDNNGGCYVDDRYHIGMDMMTRDLEYPVYAVTKGVVIDKHCSDGTWGSGNCGLFIKHQTSNGKTFIALYGHLRTKLKKGKEVEAGQVLGTTGPWKWGIHLHFGVVLGSKIPGTDVKNGIGWGMMANKHWPDNTNSFINPVEFIETHSPYAERPGYHEFLRVVERNVFGSVKVDISWYPPTKSCINADIWSVGEQCSINITRDICEVMYNKLFDVDMDFNKYDQDRYKWYRLFLGRSEITDKKLEFCK